MSKTAAVQMQITLIKQMVNNLANKDPKERAASDWTELNEALNDLVQVTYETMPPPVEIKEVPVEVPVPYEVRVPQIVEKEVVRIVRVEVPVPVFTS